jgi:hypothetical protein
MEMAFSKTIETFRFYPRRVCIRALSQGVNMFTDPQGPIEQFSWGKFIICGREHSSSEEGKAGAGKDIRLIDREVTAWRERKGHKLTEAMITGVYDQGIEILILGIGVNGALECPKKVIKSIRENGIGQVILRRTPEACALYNALFKEGKKVALLVHGTC